jgi:hypothetical protein
METNQIDKSLEELMRKALLLSFKICYTELTPNKHYFTVREGLTEAEENKAFGWCDGLMHKYYNKMSNSRCSISEMINFDLEQFEKSVIEDIEYFKEILTRISAPVILTSEEMTRRGYIGY